MRSLSAYSSGQTRCLCLNGEHNICLLSLMSSVKLMSKPSVTSCRALVKVLEENSARTDLCSVPELSLRQGSCCVLQLVFGTMCCVMCILSWVFSLFLCTFLQQLLCLWVVSLQCALGLQLSKALYLVKHVIGIPHDLPAGHKSTLKWRIAGVFW